MEWTKTSHIEGERGAIWHVKSLVVPSSPKKLWMSGMLYIDTVHIYNINENIKRKDEKGD